MAAIEAAGPQRQSKDEWVDRVLRVSPERQEGTGPDQTWRLASAECNAQAKLLRALAIKALNDAGADARMQEFETGWALFSAELAGVTTAIDRGLAAAAKAEPGQRGAVVARAVAEARSQLTGSFILSEVDDNDLMPIHIVAMLTGAFASLEKASAEGGT